MATIRMNMVDLPVNGEGARGYLAQPHDDSKHPGVVLIQEWWGIESHIIDLAQKLAAQGFVTLVPDLYHGRVATEPDDARREAMLVRESLDNALEEIRGAKDYLKALNEVDPKRIGVMGFCFGGNITYRAAESFDDIGVAVPFYGGGYDPTPESVANVKAPVLAIYGENDGGIPPEQIEKIRSLYKAAGKDYEAVVYTDAGHAFLNPTHGGYSAEAAAEAWPQAIAFLKKHLR